MSDAKKCTAKYSAAADASDDDLLSWLQYPTDDPFDRSYCAEIFDGGWPPPPPGPASITAEAAIRSFPDGVIRAERETLSSTRPHSAETESLVSTRKHMAARATITSRNSTADEALAQGAARAAGYSSMASPDPYGKVRTLMQPSDIQSRTPYSQTSTTCKESKEHPIRSDVPKSSVPGPGQKAHLNARCTKPHIFGYSPLPSDTKHDAFGSVATSTKRARKDYEAVSHVHQTGSSRITEEVAGKQRKIVSSADQGCSMMSASGSGASQGTGIGLSYKGTATSGKQKRKDLEDSTEVYADDESTDIKKHGKTSSKRNRVAEVHNLSERNRRNRINEKLKALQDLIPNSNKTDKASVLDEAIEYMKILQVQLQLVSLRSTLNVPTIMMPMALPQAHCMQMAQPHSIGLGVPIGHVPGMGLGVGILEAGTPSTSTLPVCPPAAMSHHAMQLHSGIMAAGFPHMGFFQNACVAQNMQNVQQPYEYPSQKHPDTHRSQQQNQGCHLLNYHNPDYESPSSIDKDDGGGRGGIEQADESSTL